MNYNHNFDNNNYNIFQQINSSFIIYEMLKFLNKKEVNSGLKDNFEINKYKIKVLLMNTNFIEKYLDYFLQIKVGISFSIELYFFETILNVFNEFLSLYKGHEDKKEMEDILKKYLLLISENIGKNPIKQGEELENIKDIFITNIFPKMKKYFGKGKHDFGFEFTFSLEEIKGLDIKLLNNSIFDTDIVFPEVRGYFGIGREFSFNNMSSGEKLSYARFANIYNSIFNQSKNSYKNFTILIDEPDLHLHLDWQRQYIQKLIDVFSTLSLDISLHFILATHSPFIVSDLPAESLVLLENGKEKKYEGKTFGANYIDLIRNGFFFGNPQILMGSFAENIILNIANERRKEITNSEEVKNIKLVEKIEEKIGDEFLKDNLLYFKGKNND